MGKFSFPRLIVVPVSIHLLVEYKAGAGHQCVSYFLESKTMPDLSLWSSFHMDSAFLLAALYNGFQEQIAASHEFDGVRKEKERLTAAKKKIEIKEQACDSKFKSHETHCSLTGSLSH